jgi:hypothetical protein
MNSVEVENRLLELSQLPPDWDSYGSCVITDTAISTAKKLLDILQPLRGVDLIAPMSGGGIQLEYEGNSRYLEIEILSEGNATYVFYNKGVVQTSQLEEIKSALQNL